MLEKYLKNFWGSLYCDLKIFNCLKITILWLSLFFLTGCKPLSELYVILTHPAEAMRSFGVTDLSITEQQHVLRQESASDFERCDYRTVTWLRSNHSITDRRSQSKIYYNVHLFLGDGTGTGDKHNYMGIIDPSDALIKRTSGFWFWRKEYTEWSQWRADNISATIMGRYGDQYSLMFYYYEGYTGPWWATYIGTPVCMELNGPANLLYSITYIINEPARAIRRIRHNASLVHVETSLWHYIDIIIGVPVFFFEALLAIIFGVIGLVVGTICSPIESICNIIPSILIIIKNIFYAFIDIFLELIEMIISSFQNGFLYGVISITISVFMILIWSCFFMIVFARVFKTK